ERRRSRDPVLDVDDGLSMIAVVGAGAMGSALAILHARAGAPTSLLGTKLDDAVIAACRDGRPHPVLGVNLPSGVDPRPESHWEDALANAERIVLAISSDGLADVVAALETRAPEHVEWVLATKGWDAATLRSPSEVVAAS